MATDPKPESKLAEATEKTTAALQGLQARLAREVAAPPSREETVEELGRQLEQYFSVSPKPAPPALDEIRERVIEEVVDRILRRWEDPGGTSIRNDIVGRLVKRVLEQLEK